MSHGTDEASQFKPVISTHIADDGREHSYALVRHPSATRLAVHFSAFFTRDESSKHVGEEFRGYFHRLKMLGSDPRFHWLFLCDQYGAEKNGSYYIGERGDAFVERAISDILEHVWSTLAVPKQSTFMIGSSMGATGALKFGLGHSVKGIVAICPHIDLDTCAALTNRRRNVEAICPDSDALAPHNYRYTRQIRSLLDAWPNGKPLPRLFIQDCADDKGVYREQVVPFVEAWEAHGGDVTLDLRASGGHTSAWATRPLLLDVLGRLANDDPIPVHAYQRDANFAGTLPRRDLVLEAKRLAVRLRDGLGNRMRKG